MATFSIKCPHCFRDNTSFTVVASQAHFPSANGGWKNVETFATCNACHRGVVSTINVKTPEVAVDLTKIHGVLQKSTYIPTIGDWLPRPPMPDVPDHLPPEVAQAFLEAEQLKIAGFRAPAGNSYRRALEAGLRAVDASLNGPLFKRIETLAHKGLLTPTMRDFAHRIRTLGNEASHETPVIFDEEIEDLALFSKLFLMYQFTLPAMLPPAAEGNGAK